MEAHPRLEPKSPETDIETAKRLVKARTVIDDAVGRGVDAVSLEHA